MAILRLRASKQPKQTAKQAKNVRPTVEKKTKTKTKAKPVFKVVKDEDGEYWEDLNRLLDYLFEEAKRLKMPWSKLAADAGLAEATVYNLGHRMTRRPQLRSVRNIGVALGKKIIFQNLRTAAPAVTAVVQKVQIKRIRSAAG